VSLSDSKPEPDSSKFGRAIALVRLIKADTKFISDYCCGVIGKSGKFCTRRRDGTGDTTCGTLVHIKKAPVADFHMYVWEETTNHTYLTPAMDSQVKWADEIWEMQGEEITRVQFSKLMEAAISGDATSADELSAIKTLVLNPGANVRFTPLHSAKEALVLLRHLGFTQPRLVGTHCRIS
jgi:hypothetical protein